MQARHAILRVLLEANENLMTIESVVGEDGAPDLAIHLNRELLSSVGRPAIGSFLQKLQVGAHSTPIVVLLVLS